MTHVGEEGVFLLGGALGADGLFAQRELVDFLFDRDARKIKSQQTRAEAQDAGDERREERAPEFVARGIAAERGEVAGLAVELGDRPADLEREGLAVVGLDDFQAALAPSLRRASMARCISLSLSSASREGRESRCGRACRRRPARRAPRF